MADKERLLTRTRVKRMPFEVIGKVEAKENGEGAAAAPLPKAAMGAGVAGYDNEIFDDGDHYQDILRELIERKAANTDSSDPVAMGRHWVELNRLRSKVKRKVDTKASKGRKIRYGVHEKLVNFMAPDPNVHPSSDQAKDDLFSSLFQ
jgi:protein AATF/BFR2